MEMSTQLVRLIGIAVAASMGATYHYTVSGSSDFEVTIHRPIGEVYSTFDDTRSVGSGFRDVGIAIPRIETARSANESLVYTMDSAEPGKPSRIAFTFTPGDDAITTVVTVAIDVPPIPMPSAGSGMVLSEAKIEGQFRDAVGKLGAQLDQGNTPRMANAKLAQLLDTVALAAHPKQLEAVMARKERLEAEIATAKSHLERDGYRVERAPDDQGYDIYNDRDQ